jgi:hypothetical protein
MKVGLKCWGNKEAVKEFLSWLETEFLAVHSQIKQGEKDFHAYATIRIEGVNEQ